MYVSTRQRLASKGISLWTEFVLRQKKLHHYTGKAAFAKKQYQVKNKNLKKKPGIYCKQLNLSKFVKYLFGKVVSLKKTLTDSWLNGE